MNSESDKPNKYINGKIYKIINNINDKIYIGSTIQTLAQRFYEHKRRAISEKNRVIYNAINKIGIENFKIILMEKFSCNSKEELVAREAYFIKEFNTSKNGYNRVIPKRTNYEWYKDNKEHVIDYIREWGKKNKEKVNNYKKKWEKENKEKIRLRQAQRILCETCKYNIRRGDKAVHNKTKIHINNLNNKLTSELNHDIAQE